MRNTIGTTTQLQKFLEYNLPSTNTAKKDDFIQGVLGAIASSAMHVRVTPYLLSLIDWDNPIKDPIRKQFIPFKPDFIDNHSALTLDSLNEEDDSRKAHHALIEIDLTKIQLWKA